DADALLPRGPCRQQLKRGLAIARRDNALNETLWLGDLVSRRLIHLAIEGQHAAIGAERVAFVGLTKSLLKSCSDCGAARIVVLDDDRRRLGELADEIEGAVQVEQIVVRQF